MSKLKRKANDNDKKKIKKVRFDKDVDDSAEERLDNRSEDEDDSDDGIDFKQSLDKLKDTDPEFYKYLLENDKTLLKFDYDSDEDDGDGGDEAMDDEDDSTEKLGPTKITQRLVDEWSEQLQKSPDVALIKQVVEAFKSAVEQASGRTSEGVRVEGAELFNSVVNLCRIDLIPAIHNFLKLPPPKDMQNVDGKFISPKKSKKWKRISNLIKSYLTHTLIMLNVVSDPSILSAFLRHILHLIPFFLCFVHLTKKLAKKAIELWSEGEEKVRILSFLCIVRVSRNEDTLMLHFILKRAYLAYVKNCKFMTIDSLPMINFMTKSLVELYSLDQKVAYQHAFIFIKQLAIQLRNASTLKKKESLKSVFNWQYLNSLKLWAQLICSLNESKILELLKFPLVQVIFGTIKLNPSTRYFPLRFHLIDLLIKISSETATFIPILPIITEAFERVDFNKKAKNMKQIEMNFDILIKVSKQVINEFQFKEEAINKLYQLSFYYLSTQSNKIAFPELVQVSTIKIKKYLKTNNNRHLQKIKQLLEKMEENAKFIEEKRKNVSFAINDASAIDVWESERKDEGTPINKFYEQWQKLRLRREKSASKREKKETDDVEEESIQSSEELPKPQSKAKATKKKPKNKVKKSNKFSGQDINFSGALDLSSDDND